MTTAESAVERCVKAYYEACEREDPRAYDPDAPQRVRLAYRHAMPYLLHDLDSVDAFITCVTHGLVIQVFQPAEASKLLYAVQVSLGLIRARNEAARHQSKSQSKTQPQQADTPTPLPLNQGDPFEPQTSCAPSMGTVSSSPWVGDHEPQPTVPAAATPTPTPPSQMGPKAQSAAPQAPRNQVDVLLEQLYAGKLPAESPPTPCPAVLKAAPPTPSPYRTRRSRS